MSRPIVDQAFALVEAVGRFSGRVRPYYYQVALIGHGCPDCGGRLEMVREGLCRCIACRKETDPTVAFQTCPACGGSLWLQVRRYRCVSCGQDVSSRFLFDGLVFDTEYFRQKMAESRQRKAEQRERVRQMLEESRSGAIEPGPADLTSIPGLLEALNGLTAGIPQALTIAAKDLFDLECYQNHIQAHLRPIETAFDQIPPLSGNLRIDRVWRFIAIIFLAHAGVITVRQDGQTIWVSGYETD